MIGPNDKITLYYKIGADQNITSGTYLMDFQVQGGYDMLTINRQIPIKVDLATVNMASAKIVHITKPTLNLNVANPRENTLNAVTIVPSAQGISFSPDQYYIGTMDPDEVFTISFTLASDDPTKPIQGATNVSFVAKFKNGDTWHESEPYIARYSPPLDNTKTEQLPAASGACGPDHRSLQAAICIAERKLSNKAQNGIMRIGNEISDLISRGGADEVT